MKRASAYVLIGAIIVVNTALSQWQRRSGE